MRDAELRIPHPASRKVRDAGCGLRVAESNEIALLGFHSLELRRFAHMHIGIARGSQLKMDVV